MLATLRRDAPVSADIDAMAWRGPQPGFEVVTRELGAPELWERAKAALATVAPGA